LVEILALFFAFDKKKNIVFIVCLPPHPYPDCPRTVIPDLIRNPVAMENSPAKGFWNKFRM